MIKGVGCDLVSVSRIKSLMTEHGERFASRILSPDELVGFVLKESSAAFLAKRFAAKEAISKALGTGIGTTVSFQDITITNDHLGAPKVALSSTCQQKLGSIPTIHLSISDEHEYAQAFAVCSMS